MVWGGGGGGDGVMMFFWGVVDGIGVDVVVVGVALRVYVGAGVVGV